MATVSFENAWRLTPEQAELVLNVLDDDSEGVTIPDNTELERGDESFKQYILNSEEFWKLPHQKS